MAKGSFVGLIESVVLENRKFEEKRFAGSKAVKCIGYTTKNGYLSVCKSFRAIALLW